MPKPIFDPELWAKESVTWLLGQRTDQNELASYLEGFAKHMEEAKKQKALKLSNYKVGDQILGIFKEGGKLFYDYRVIDKIDVSLSVKIIEFTYYCGNLEVIDFCKTEEEADARIRDLM